MKWTQAQGEAIASRGSTLLVSAGAGSGKTAVLTARILSLLSEGTPLDKLLVVTFTRAAAAEMRARIVDALHEAVSAGEKKLAEQAFCVERADITTLHGFCAKVCREYFHAVRADPMFRVMDERERNVLAERALDEALLSCFEMPTECFSYAALCLTQEQIREAALSLHQFILTRPDPFQWLEQMIAMTEETERPESSVWARELLESAEWSLQSARHLYQTLLAELDDYPKYQTYILKEREACDTLLKEIPNGVSACAHATKKETTRKPAKSKDSDEAFEDWFSKTNQKARDAVDEACNIVEWLSDTDARREENRTACRILRGIAEVVKRFDEAFTRMKTTRNCLDYNDLEHYAYEALSREDIAIAYRTKYAHVFVDEYQDSSLLQEAILQCVSRQGGLFMVGDVKQSIYRFRQAEPSLFLEKLSSFQSLESAPFRSIFLNQNFRSHPAVLRCVNALFEKVFWGEPMEIAYDENARLIAGGEWSPIKAPVELHVISTKDIAADDDPAETESIRQEARVIANRIIALQNAEEKGYALSEMAILLRVMKGQASHVADVLRQFGIAAKADIGEDTLSQVEIQDALSLLKTIDNFHQDVPLIASLKGPALGLSSEEIAAVRVNHPQGSFSEAVLAYAEKDDPLAEALRDFRSEINAWAMDALVCPLDSLIRKICEQKHLFQVAGAMPDGKIRQEHLYLLAEAAAIFQQNEEGGLGGFLRYIDRIQKRDGMAAQNLGEREHVVRILSVHKSKGLQFPVVFVAGLGCAFTYQETQAALQAHATLGVGIHAIDPELRLKQDTMVRKAIARRKKTEALAEQARILYVALTRAESRLILVGTADKDIAEYEKEDARFAKSFLQWIIPVALRDPDWRVEIHPVETSGNAEIRRQVLREIIQDIRSAGKPFSGGMVSQTLSWQRPHIQTEPLKQSVTQRVREMDEAYVQKLEDLPARPLFLEKRGLTPAEKGEATHAFLRTIPAHEKDFEAACRSIVARGILSEEQANALPAKELKAFLNHPLWRRISDAPRMSREWAFNLRQDQGGSVTLLQGVIDCCFIENQQWVLVDYKTDHADEAAIVARHREQVLLYADALWRLTGIPVREKILYAVALGEALRVDEGDMKG